MSYNLSELEAIANDADARVEALETGVQAVIDSLEITDEHADRQWLVERAQTMLRRLLETGSVEPAPAAISAPSVRINGSGNPVTVEPKCAPVGDPATVNRQAAMYARGVNGRAVDRLIVDEDFPCCAQPVRPRVRRGKSSTVPTMFPTPQTTVRAVHAYWCLSLTLTGEAGPCNCGRGL